MILYTWLGVRNYPEPALKEDSNGPRGSLLSFPTSPLAGLTLSCSVALAQTRAFWVGSSTTPEYWCSGSVIFRPRKVTLEIWPNCRRSVSASKVYSSTGGRSGGCELGRGEREETGSAFCGCRDAAASGENQPFPLNSLIRCHYIPEYVTVLWLHPGPPSEIISRKSK